MSQSAAVVRLSGASTRARSGSSLARLSRASVPADALDVAVHGTVVKSLAKTGAAAKTDGIYGLRINHHLDVQVDGLGVSKNPA